jgi:histidinol-phosphate/aromatic aminotransferase/cobyric acid decarboxylase-like protein
VHGGLNAAIRMRLLREHRVCVRDCASFGLPEHVRIGVRLMEDCRRLAGALQEVMVTSDG